MGSVSCPDCLIACFFCSECKFFYQLAHVSCPDFLFTFFAVQLVSPFSSWLVFHALTAFCFLCCSESQCFYLMTHVSCPDCFLHFLLFRMWVLLANGLCFMFWLPVCIFVVQLVSPSWVILLYFCSLNLFTNIITVRYHLQHIFFQWCRYVWLIILLTYLTHILGWWPLYATPHYDWSFLSFIISAIT